MLKPHCQNRGKNHTKDTANKFFQNMAKLNINEWGQWKQTVFIKKLKSGLDLGNTCNHSDQ
jgi:hypothetical protein